MMTNKYPDPPFFLKLIAHDLRWKILQILANGDLRVQELSQVIGQPQNLVSYHLHKLHLAQLILEHKSISDGREIYYGLDFENIDGQLSSIGHLIHPAFSTIDFENRKVNNKRVLFICTHNSARSQMAEGFLRNLAGGELQVFSAGTEPTMVHPLAIKAMAKRGIDITRQTSKGLDEFINLAFDIVITVCDRARETCPIFPGNPTQIHWSIPDPTDNMGSKNEKFEQFEATADQISIRIKYLIRGFLVSH
jgi:thioredoxin type arsenate reductase